MTKIEDILILTRSELAGLMSLEDYIEGIEDAFRKHGQGQSFGTGMLHGETPGELEFHIKSGGLRLGDRAYFGLKINGSCFSNLKVRGLPNIMGAILLFDGEYGQPLAIVDSIDPTIKRTGAGTAVALKYLALPGSRVLTLCGCGNQGRFHSRFLKAVFPLEQIFAWDQDDIAADTFAAEMQESLGISVSAVSDLATVASQSQLIITCTPSKEAFLNQASISPGTTIAAVGSDSPDKQELDPGLLIKNKVVVDILAQCAKVGELHHALNTGEMTTEEVYAEIGEIVAGRKLGRENEDEIIVYDSTGTALQDTAAAALCYEKAKLHNIGQTVNLSE